MTQDMICDYCHEEFEVESEGIPTVLGEWCVVECTRCNKTQRATCEEIKYYFHTSKDPEILELKERIKGLEVANEILRGMAAAPAHIDDRLAGASNLTEVEIANADEALTTLARELKWYKRGSIPGVFADCPSSGGMYRISQGTLTVELRFRKHPEGLAEFLGEFVDVETAKEVAQSHCVNHLKYHR